MITNVLLQPHVNPKSTPVMCVLTRADLFLHGPGCTMVKSHPRVQNEIDVRSLGSDHNVLENANNWCGNETDRTTDWL